jgi:hypothetical protein
MADRLQIDTTTRAGDPGSTTLEDVLKALPRNKQLILHWDAASNRAVANVAGSSVATGEDVASAVGAAFARHLTTVQVENPLRKREPSYISPLKRPLAGDTIPPGSIPGR